MSRNPYEVLGVSPSADKEEVRKAYLELAKKYHPDQYKGHPLEKVAEEKMQEINAAYDTLSHANQADSGANYGSTGNYNADSSANNTQWGATGPGAGGPYYQQRNGCGSGCCSTDLLCSLCILDSLCECMGGDLVPCC